MYIDMDMKLRTYDMTTRGAAKTATRDAIMRACIDLFTEQRSLAISLPAVAERADVTVKTVLRHFGSREALIDAACQKMFDDAVAERSTLPDENPSRALEVLIAHYERRGEMVLAMLAQENNDPRTKSMTDAGRTKHRQWVETVFGTQLPRQSAPRSRLIDALVVATDVYSWKLLRMDRGLSVEDVHDRMYFTTQAILAAS